MELWATPPNDDGLVSEGGEMKLTLLLALVLLAANVAAQDKLPTAMTVNRSECADINDATVCHATAFMMVNKQRVWSRLWCTHPIGKPLTNSCALLAEKSTYEFEGIGDSRPAQCSPHTMRYVPLPLPDQPTRAFEVKVYCIKLENRPVVPYRAMDLIYSVFADPAPDPFGRL